MGKETSLHVLENIEKRLSLFVDPLNAETLRNFFSGFMLGRITASSHLHYADYTDAWIDAVTKRGWNVNTVKLIDSFYETGLTEPEVIREFVEIEKETWRILEEKFPA